MSSYLKGIANRINNATNEGFTQELDINLLVPSKKNFFGIRLVEELMESIEENGLMHNLVVKKQSDGKYEIIAGERRYTALKQLGYKKVPCKILKEETKDLDSEIMMIKSNTINRELNLQEKMQSISRLQEIYAEKRKNGEKLQGKTRDLIGKHLGMSGSQVGRYQKIDKDLIEPLKDKLDKHELTVTQAHTISSLSKDEQNIIHDEIKDLDHNESKEEIEIFINGIKQPVENKYDKEFIHEMYSESHSKSDIVVSDCAKIADENMQKREIKTEYNEIKNKIDELRETIKQARRIDLIINMSYIKGCFKVSKVELNDMTLELYLEGQKNILLIEINQLERVSKINYNDSILNPNMAYRINFDTYLWFHNSVKKGEEYNG